VDKWKGKLVWNKEGDSNSISKDTRTSSASSPPYISFWAHWVHHTWTVMYRWTNLNYIVQNTNERVAILNQFVSALSPSTHIGRLCTFETLRTCVICISFPRLWSGSSGWGSAARRYLAQKKERFVRKPIWGEETSHLKTENYIMREEQQSNSDQRPKAEGRSIHPFSCISFLVHVYAP
jgi:hypothetical protein